MHSANIPRNPAVYKHIHYNEKQMLEEDKFTMGLFAECILPTVAEI